MRNLVGKTKTKKVPFMDGKLEIKKLTSGQIKAIGARSKTFKDEDEDKAFKELLFTFQQAVVLPEDETLDLELLEEFPIDELIHLSQEIMEFAGVPKADLGNVG